MGDVVVSSGRGKRRVVAAFPLPPSARDKLRDLLGDELEIVDIREADGTEALVLVPSVSRQLIGKLGAAFPAGRVVVMELEDAEHGIRLGGPVSRAFEAGADGYFVADSIDELAVVVRRLGESRATGIPSERPPALMAAEQELDKIVDMILHHRQRTS